jgi:hypothetical protein
MSDTTIALLASLGSLLGTFVVLYRAIKLTPKEVKQADADLVAKYATATGIAIDQLKEVLERLQDVTGECTQCLDLVESLYEGIGLLISQLESSGIEPKWRPQRRVPGNRRATA